MTTNEFWVINAPSVVSEIIDGELVVMNMINGSYYSSTGVGSFVWTCIEQQLNQPAIVAAIADAFSVAEAQIRNDIDSFIAALEKEQLIKRVASSQGAGKPPPHPKDSQYIIPELNIYSDMKDLLLLDPIHEVGEAGWPMRPADPQR